MSSLLMSSLPFLSPSQVYAGNFLDTDVDMSLLGEPEGKEGGLNKAEKGSMLSTRSSSAYTSVNASCPLNTKCSDAVRVREEATVQVEENYTYGSCRKISLSHLQPLPVHAGPSNTVSQIFLCSS